VRSLRIGRESTLAAAAVALMAALTAAGSPAGAAAAGPLQQYRHVCAATAPAGQAECLALVPVKARAAASAAAAPAAPAGYWPADLRAAYNLTGAAVSSGRGQTVALVDAYDDPDAERDLGRYRSRFGLPACTTANGCFRKVSQKGAAKPLPAAAGTNGWATEESLDLDVVAAICPNCHIILVEADDSKVSSLAAAAATAVRLGARFVSNSYGTPDYSGETTAADSYDHPGVVVTASAGDSGYGAEYPAASPYVTSVGGTSLARDSSTARGWTETVWGDSASGQLGTGSGCSAYEPKPHWQTDSGCGHHRTVADVSADADPDTGAAIYDAYDQGGWLVVGGTSAASPIIAAVYALAGTPGSGSFPAAYPYAHASLLNDVTSGSNGTCGSYLCNARPGYDGPTGLGTPDGTGAFKTGTVKVSNPGQQLSFRGIKISPLQIRATDSNTGQSLSYTATGLPRGLSIGPAGKISGTPRSLQYRTVTVKVTDKTGASASTSFSWDDGSQGSITSGLSATRCLTARSGSYKSGTAIEIARCNGGRAQRWIIYAGPKGEDVIELAAGDRSRSSQSGCLGVRGGSTAAGAKIAAFNCTRNASLLWKAARYGHLTGQHSGKCLADPGAGRNGTQLTIAICKPQDQERWTLP
jgi:hypothetical protein